MRPGFARRFIPRSRLQRAGVGVGLLIGLTILIALPTGGAGVSIFSWGTPRAIDVSAPFGGGTPFSTISCPSSSLCVAGDASGNILASTNPTAGASSWSVVDPGDNEDDAILQLSCPSVTECVALSSTRAILASNAPDSASWTSININGIDDLATLSCPTTTLCVALGTQGEVVTSTNPTGGATEWSTPAVIDQGAELDTFLDTLSCPTTTLCVALDDNGDIVTSTNPTGGSGAWSSGVSLDGANLIALSCAAATKCVAMTMDGAVFTSTNPTGGEGAWTAVGTVNVDAQSVSSSITALD